MGTRRIAVSRKWMRNKLAEATAQARTYPWNTESIKEEMPYIPTDAFVSDPIAIVNQDIFVFTIYHPAFKDNGMAVTHYEIPEQFA